jgi:hypothetical protein
MSFTLTQKAKTVYVFPLTLLGNNMAVRRTQQGRQGVRFLRVLSQKHPNHRYMTFAISNARHSTTSYASARTSQRTLNYIRPVTPSYMYAVFMKNVLFLLD